MALLGLISGNLMESEKKTLKTDSNFAPSFADHHLNGHCLIKNISIPKNSGRSKWKR